MQESIATLGSLDDETVRACKRFDTSLDQFDALKKGNEKAFETLHDATTACENKRKAVLQAKTALLKLEGYLRAQAPIIAQIMAEKPSASEFFSSVLDRMYHQAEELTEALATEVKLDLGQLSRVIENFPTILGLEGGLKLWRKSFDERTELVEGQATHLVNAAKVVEQTLNKALAKISQPVEARTELTVSL
jgi:hypothetical protein